MCFTKQTKQHDKSSITVLVVAADRKLEMGKKKKMFLEAVLQVAPSKKCILVPT